MPRPPARLLRLLLCGSAAQLLLSESEVGSQQPSE